MFLPPFSRRIAQRVQAKSFSINRAPETPTSRLFHASAIRLYGKAARIDAKRRPLPTRRVALIAGVGLFSLSVGLANIPPAKCDSPANHIDNAQSDGRDPNLPRFRVSEIRKHDGKSMHPWVMRGDKVYDITDWVGAHPGGEVILQAAGGSIDRYWDIFTIHKNQYVYDILAQYCIGYVHSADLVDGKPAQDEIEDPFHDDPERHPALITKTSKPRNAETPADAMGADFITPNELFYVRNHMWVPRVEDPDDYTLTIELVDGTEKQYTLRDLRTKFPSHKVTAVLQCSGNRRKHMSEGSGRSTNGLQWTAGAISNACWEGVLLSDVLADAGLDIQEGLLGTSEAKHVQFKGLEAYGASIPLKKAIDPQGDVLLAYSMNGKPLPRDHGFPLRSVVPGHVAARSVKWLSHITLSEEESTSQWQRRDYKCFGPNQTQVDWDKAPAIQELPVQSAITECKLGAWKTIKDSLSKGNEPPVTKQAQEVSLTGYAYSGGGREIIRVDVSLDGGKSWTQAEILPDCTTKDGTPSPCLGHGSWAWRRWKYTGQVPLDAFETAREPSDTDAGQVCHTKDNTRRCATFVVKATDESYNTQPESHAATWNIRGNLATAWHRMKVCSECPTLGQQGGGVGAAAMAA